VDRVREEFVQLWGALGTFWGVPPTTARVFGWLMSRSEPADAQEIMAGLELSRGAVSMACRELREWKLIAPERVAGARRVVYRPETDLERVLRNVVEIRKRREWDPIRENMRDWIPALEAQSSGEGGPSPENAVFLRRLREIDQVMGRVDSIAEFLLNGGTVTDFGLKALLGAGAVAARLGNLARREAQSFSGKSSPPAEPVPDLDPEEQES
jgi:DNA-binding transcriptional regulator GbsR (MarR family)